MQILHQILLFQFWWAPSSQKTNKHLFCVISNDLFLIFLIASTFSRLIQIHFKPFWIINYSLHFWDFAKCSFSSLALTREWMSWAILLCRRVLKAHERLCGEKLFHHSVCSRCFMVSLWWAADVALVMLLFAELVKYRRVCMISEVNRTR